MGRNEKADMGRALRKTLSNLVSWPPPVETIRPSVLNTRWQSALLKQSRILIILPSRSASNVPVLGKTIITWLLLMQPIAVMKPRQASPFDTLRAKK